MWGNQAPYGGWCAIGRRSARTGMPPRTPDDHLTNYYSESLVCAPMSTWVSARFSPVRDDLLFIGGDLGHLAVVDVRPQVTPEQAFPHCFEAHNGAVLDIVGVPTREHELLTFSGAEARIWSLDRSPVGHAIFYADMSIRCAAFAPDDPNVFATGTREGAILQWDRRYNAKQRQGIEVRTPCNTYKNAHGPHGPAQAVASTKRRSALSTSVSITAMAFLNEHTLLTASSVASSGVRVWDTRKMPVREQSRPLLTYELPASQSRAVSTFSLDRFRSALFVATSNGCIYEFCIASACLKPVRTYLGPDFGGDLYMQVACSPVSDHLICGSSDNEALIWDIQPFHAYASTGPPEAAALYSTAIRPSFRLGGHSRAVATVGWSRNGTYIVSMDQGDFRVWKEAERSGSALNEVAEEADIAFEVVQRVERRKEEAAEKALQLWEITPGSRLFLSPSKANMPPLPKRKQPFASPFKVNLFGSADDNKENIPPAAKASRLDPLTSRGRSNEKARGEGERLEAERRKRNPFYFKHPTMHLPNSVLERHLERKRSRSQRPPPETPRLTQDKLRSTGGWWQRSQKLTQTSTDSYGSEVLTTPRFNISVVSPRKITVKDGNKKKKKKQERSLSRPPSNCEKRRPASRNTSILDFVVKES